MKTLPELGKRIKAKTEKILALQEALLKDNMQLKDQVNKLKSRVEELEKSKVELEDQYKALQLARTISGENTDKNLAIKLKINELVREIDKCIAQLNR